MRVQILHHNVSPGFARRPQGKLTGKTSNDIKKFLAVNPLSSLADTLEHSVDEGLLILGDICTGENTGGALADQSRGVGHDANSVGRTAVARLEPALETVEGNAGSDTDDNRQSGAGRPSSTELLTDALCDLGLDSNDDQVGIATGLDIGGGGADAERGHLLTVDIPRFGDADVLLVDALADQAANDGGGHVATTDKGQFALLKGRHCVICDSFKAWGIPQLFKSLVGQLSPAR